MQTIMIIEDDPVIREELAFLLENENYRVLSVRRDTGNRAYYRRHQSDLCFG